MSEALSSSGMLALVPLPAPERGRGGEGLPYAVGVAVADGVVDDFRIFAI